jgi:hypothetical protein
MSKFELSIQTPEGTEYKDWETVQRDILQELISSELILGIDEDCGKKLSDILNDEDLWNLGLDMATHESYDAMAKIIMQEFGFCSYYSIFNFLSKLMLIGNGECPFCGASSYQEIPMSLDYEYDQDDGNHMKWLSPPKRICHNCQYEWSVEE